LRVSKLLARLGKSVRQWDRPAMGGRGRPVAAEQQRPL